MVVVSRCVGRRLQEVVFAVAASTSCMGEAAMSLRGTVVRGEHTTHSCDDSAASGVPLEGAKVRVYWVFSPKATCDNFSERDERAFPNVKWSDENGMFYVSIMFGGLGPARFLLCADKPGFEPFSYMFTYPDDVTPRLCRQYVNIVLRRTTNEAAP